MIARLKLPKQSGEKLKMSQQVQDIYDDDEFEVLLESARMNAANDWEETFISDLSSKFEEYGKRMYLSDSQLEHLERIASDE